MKVTTREVKFRDPNGRMVSSLVIGNGSLHDEVADYLDNNPEPVATATGEWLTENITQPTTPVVDASLSVSGAAADSKKVGDELNDLKSEIELSGGSGQPVPVTLSSEMTDTDKIYLYLGEETGYDYGYIYAYVNNAWAKTTLYGRGQNGSDGFSPQISVAETSTGVSITATDKNGTTVATVENGTATAEQVASWLDNHPEATTTVQDGSVSVSKLSSDTMMLFKRIARIIAKALYKVDKSDEILDLKEAIGMTTYTITYNLAGATVDSDVSVIDELEGFTATVTKDDAEYIYKTVSITMGGTDITSSVWDSSTGVIDIPSVTGNVVINVVVTSEYGWTDGVAYDFTEYPLVAHSLLKNDGTFEYSSSNSSCRTQYLPCHTANAIEFVSGNPSRMATYDSEKVFGSYKASTATWWPIPASAYYIIFSEAYGSINSSTKIIPHKLEVLGENTIPESGVHYRVTNPVVTYMRCYGMAKFILTVTSRQGAIFYDTNKNELSRISAANNFYTASIPEGAVYFRLLDGYENALNICVFEEASA